MQEDKWSSEPARSYMPLQTSYSPYPSDFTNQPPAPMPGMTNSSPMPGLMSSSQPPTPRPDMMSPPPLDKSTPPDLIRRRPPLPARPASFTTTTFHSNPYPGVASLRRRRTESSMFSFETGPSFSQTKQLLDLWNIDQSNGYQLHINAKMDRGFFRAEQDWTCYRRNYFQVSATFDVHGTNYLVQGPEVPCLVKNEAQEIHQVDFFSIGITSRVSGSDKKIELVQHTPKRDKGPQMIPEPRVVSAGGNLHLASVGSNHNIVTFERMQFKTATANNGKRRAAQQYYEIVVDLYANTATGKQFKVASCTSAPLVVRGRSPGHYADSHARYRSMDAGQPINQQQPSLPPDERYLPPSAAPVPGGYGQRPEFTSPFSSYPNYQPQYQMPYPPQQPPHHHGVRPDENRGNENYMVPSYSHPMEPRMNNQEVYPTSEKFGYMRPQHENNPDAGRPPNKYLQQNAQ